MNDEAAPARIRVLIVDHHAMVRSGLQAALSSEPGIEVVGATDNVEEALVFAAQADPGLVVTELQLGGRSAMDLLAALRKAGSRARLLVLTSETSEAHLRLAMSAGAHAYLLKEDGYSELLEALRVVHSGRRFFSDTVESTILRQYAERCAVRFSKSAALITPRQREVLARIGQGQTNKVIANALRLSVKTVEKHRSNLMRKLGLHNTAGVTVYAIRQGLVNQDTGAITRAGAGAGKN
ncbi:MAG TPA: response regulator transcription factor [Steroidobacteraceae bacterium]|nr:response regulator transcription factor [Steroidobacteraceae bacterium]